jgi:hypothetical protein
MIQGYPRDPSVRPGGQLTLHVSTDQPKFRVEFYRQGQQLTRMDGVASIPLPGFNYPPGPTDRDWGWPAYDFDIPAHWPSGAYIAMLVEIDAEGNEIAPDRGTTDGTSAKALFVVRSATPGAETPILYKLSWATYHAYNGTGYGSLYAETVWSEHDNPPGFKVTTRRPGGGTGGVVMMGDPPDYYAPESRRQTFEHWDAPFIRWLEGSGYRLDYCTDLDLHQDPTLLKPYNLLLSVGHDEYWSAGMRAAVDRFVQDGGNMAYFSGNIAFFRIHFTDHDTAITCAKAEPSGNAARWEQDVWSLSDPENRTTGVEFAGGWFDGKRDAVGYTVQHAEHWVFENTGLGDGDVFGNDADMPLVGYECDGAPYVRKHGWVQTNGRHGTPPTFFVLGLAELGPGWQFTIADRPAATMGVYTSPAGGIVFQGATTDWPMVVARNKIVQQITKNVLNRLKLRSARIVGPLPPRFGRAVAAAGDLASFHVDVAELPFNDRLEYDWNVGGAQLLVADHGRVDVQLPDQVHPVTVSITIRNEFGPVAFGTHTVLPLSREAILRFELSHLLHNMITPGDPETARMALLDPQLLGERMTSVNLPLIQNRAARLRQVAAELLELCTGDGHRRIIPDPRRPWNRAASTARKPES